MMWLLCHAEQCYCPVKEAASYLARMLQNSDEGLSWCSAPGAEKVAGDAMAREGLRGWYVSIQPPSSLTQWQMRWNGALLGKGYDISG